MKPFPFILLAFVAAGLSACGGSMPFLPHAEVSREWVQADLRARLGDSQLSTFELEKQTIRWVEQHMSARFGEPLQLSSMGRGQEGDRLVWVAYLEGTIARTIMPGPYTNPQVPGFSKVLLLISPDGGGTITALAKPLPPR